jgi:hypothetical protein
MLNVEDITKKKKNMADTIRIRTTPNGEDKYIKINVEQNLILLRFCR